MNILWSICIPTYNRAKFLEGCIASLNKQINISNRDDVEILVSDNASTDETNIIIAKYIKNGLKISYYKNANNIGPDANFLQCINLAKGKYVLLLGDDDVLMEGTIDTVLQFLKRDNYGVVYIGGYGFSDKPRCINAPTFEQAKQKVFFDGNEFLRQVSIYVTFISSNIFNKDYVLNDFDYDRYRNSSFVQVPFYVISALRATKNLYLGQSRYVGAKTNNSGGYGVFDTFGIKFNKVLRELKVYGLANKTINYINEVLIRRHYSEAILITKKKNNYVAEEINILENIYKDNCLFWIFDFVMYKLPYPLAKLYFFFIRVVNKILKEIFNR
jgi:abequosyltransferase